MPVCGMRGVNVCVGRPMLQELERNEQHVELVEGMEQNNVHRMVPNNNE